MQLTDVTLEWGADWECDIGSSPTASISMPPEWEQVSGHEI